jgi:hypothetical protein
VISWFRFVVHDEVARYERQGWTVVAHLGPVHGAYAVLMRWRSEDKPTAMTEAVGERDPAPATLRAS